MWRPIKDAPKDGTKIMGQDAVGKRQTWFGKLPGVTEYGWCYAGHDKTVSWNPTVWEKIK